MHIATCKCIFTDHYVIIDVNNNNNGNGDDDCGDDDDDDKNDCYKGENILKQV